MDSHLLIAELRAYSISVLFGKLSSMWMHSRSFITHFLFCRFSVTRFILRFFIHFNVSVVQSDKYGSICILLHADIFSQKLKTILKFSCKDKDSR